MEGKVSWSRARIMCGKRHRTRNELPYARIEAIDVSSILAEVANEHPLTRWIGLYAVRMRSLLPCWVWTKGARMHPEIRRATEASVGIEGNRDNRRAGIV